jgi:hypothetical protein
MEQMEWEKTITEYMTKGGWSKDKDDEKTLGFTLLQGNKLWTRDYDKKQRSFVHYDGNHKVNIRIKKELK